VLKQILFVGKPFVTDIAFMLFVKQVNLLDVSLHAEGACKVLTAVHAVLLVSLMNLFHIVCDDLTFKVDPVLLLGDALKLLVLQNDHLRCRDDVLQFHLFIGASLFVQLLQLCSIDTLQLKESIRSCLELLINLFELLDLLLKLFGVELYRHVCFLDNLI
jgi:hypothetical protein